MKFVLGLIFAAVAVSALSDDERSRLALQNPDLFEGDILGFEPGDRNVVPHKQMRWPNKKIPYVIDISIQHRKSTILEAMNDFHMNTCLRFVPRTTENNYIKFLSGKGCYSHVGMTGRGAQPLSLGNGCMQIGSIIHELGHAIGFFHEHNRSDRDQFLVIYWQNIQKGMESQFALLAPHQNILLAPFDHDSIMMYGNYAFSKGENLKSMIAKNGKILTEPYQKRGLSITDIKKVRKMYNC